MKLANGWKAAAVGVVLLLMMPPALADDIIPPPWDRYGPESTYQRYEFSTPDPVLTPEEFYNPFGFPEGLVTPGPGMGWLAEYAGRFGVWELSGMIELWVPNHDMDWPFKDIWVQLTWLPQPGGPGAYPGIYTEPEAVEVGIVNEIFLPDGWIHTTVLIYLEPNPDSEYGYVFGDINVDELVVDTICYPEPGTLALMGFGGVLTLLRRRRK